MYFPEWEVEELLKSNPQLLELALEGLQFVKSQRYLSTPGRFIDLLFKSEDNYVIVEIKSPIIKEKSIVIDQLLEYKKFLAKETGVTDGKIFCVLVSPNGFTDELLKFCESKGVIAKTIDQTKLLGTVQKINSQKQSLDAYFSKNDERKNRQSLDAYFSNEDKRLWLTPGIIKNKKKHLARIFLLISEKAPIEAHEILTNTPGKLSTNQDKWFWLFYSVMDRRANAATFIRAKIALEQTQLFSPYSIVELLSREGESYTLRKINRILSDAKFPLLTDHSKGDLAFPQSIVDAAKFMGKFNFSFQQMYDFYTNQTSTLKDARNQLWKDLQDNIYGVGPRIASQIIRGLVLKGSWNLPLDDDRFLEEGRFNVWIAGITRLGLVDNDAEYYKQLGEFADKYLDGNRGVIAHVLWYTRKRYCGRPPKCDECELANYCKRAFSFSNKGSTLANSRQTDKSQSNL